MTEPIQVLTAQERIDAARSWTAMLTSKWRAAWTSASDAARAQAVRDSLRVPARVQMDYYAWLEPGRPIAATGLVVTSDPTRPDGAFRAAVIDGCGRYGDAPDAPAVLDLLRTDYEIMADNWFAGRTRAPRPSPPSICTCPALDGRDGVVWFLRDDFARMDLDEFIAHVLPTDVTLMQVVDVTSSSPFGPPRHLFAAGQNRELESLLAWLQVDPESLPAALGITPPWWCGINIPRRLVFGTRDEGDVDLLFGPPELDLPEATRTAWWKEITERESLGTHPTQIWGMVTNRALREGCLKWPASGGWLGAVEAKASWIEPGAKHLKSSHQHAGARVTGQLRRLVDAGFERVAFLHLLATKPSSDARRNAHAVAEEALRAALAAAPNVFQRKELPGCGYYRATLGAVPHTAEWASGSTYGLRHVAAATDLPSVAPERDWRSQLHAQLQALGQPRALRWFVRHCAECDALVASPWPGRFKAQCGHVVM